MSDAPPIASQGLVEKLRSVPVFATVNDEDRECLEGAEERSFSTGEVLVREGDLASLFFVLLEGEVSVSKRYGDQQVVLARHKAGAFFGEVPLLLGVPYTVTGRATSEGRVITFPEETFWKLLRLCRSIAGEIFRTMSTRLKSLEGSSQQRERLSALGTMSAGLAHELNNPSSAAMRAAANLEETVAAVQNIAQRLHRTIAPEHWRILISAAGPALNAGGTLKDRVNSLEQSDREDSMLSLLKKLGVTDAWKIAPTLAGAGFDASAIETLRKNLPPESLGDAVHWLDARLTIRALLEEAEQSTDRIAKLVGAVRAYTRQERSESDEVDVEEQINQTLARLAPKLLGVTIRRDFDQSLGRIPGYSNELAQVWSNLVDNAADALNGIGELSVRTWREGLQAVVEIADTGPGIPETNLTRIFEPFFTTKGVGSGVGLGLVTSQRIVADRHGGEIEVESGLGRTRFVVRLPIRKEGAIPSQKESENGGAAELKQHLATAASRAAEPLPPVIGSFQSVDDVPLFAQLASDARACLAGGAEIRCRAGEAVIHQGAPSEYFFVVLEGELRVLKNYGAQEVVLAEQKPGNFFGEIQIMLDLPYVATVRALGESRLFRLSRQGFWELLRASPEIARAIMRTLATRVRNMEGYSQGREKLEQLGTMAAGLAHELNNPAAAARRAASDLRENVEAVQSLACELNQTLDTEQWERLLASAREAIHCTVTLPRLEALDQADREDAIGSWLERMGLSNGWELAPALVNARVEVHELESLAASVPPELLESAVRWLTATTVTRELLGSIKHSTSRIGELVQAVKSYSFMDQAPWQEIDLHEGLESTLTILGHKLKSVTVIRDFDRTVPRLCAYGGELNQVWTNLIDNAIYAVRGTGKICVHTRREGDWAVVEIADDGSGIPPEVRPHIFEPFFTTKGEYGTGLGLIISHQIIVERHHGQIAVDSRPGETRFTIRLPLESSETH